MHRKKTAVASEEDCRCKFRNETYQHVILMYVYRSCRALLVSKRKAPRLLVENRATVHTVLWGLRGSGA